MELTINIKEQSKIDTFLNLLAKMEYVEIINIKENGSSIPSEHRDALSTRLNKIRNGETTFRSWDLIKKQFENKNL